MGLNKRIFFSLDTLQTMTLKPTKSRIQRAKVRVNSSYSGGEVTVLLGNIIHRLKISPTHI